MQNSLGFGADLPFTISYALAAGVLLAGHCYQKYAKQPFGEEPLA